MMTGSEMDTMATLLEMVDRWQARHKAAEAELEEMRAAVVAVHQWLELEKACPTYPLDMPRTFDDVQEFRDKWRAECLKLHNEAAGLVRAVVAKYPSSDESTP